MSCVFSCVHQLCLVKSFDALRFGLSLVCGCGLGKTCFVERNGQSFVCVQLWCDSSFPQTNGCQESMQCLCLTMSATCAHHDDESQSYAWTSLSTRWFFTQTFPEWTCLRETMLSVGYQQKVSLPLVVACLTILVVQHMWNIDVFFFRGNHRGTPTLRQTRPTACAHGDSVYFGVVFY